MRQTISPLFTGQICCPNVKIPFDVIFDEGGWTHLVKLGAFDDFCILLISLTYSKHSESEN